MSVADVCTRAFGHLRAQPNALLPYYALIAAAGDVARLPLLVGVLVAVVALETTGRLGPLVDELAAANPERLGQPAPADVAASAADPVGGALFAPAVVVPLLAGVGVAVVAGVVARGVTRAAALESMLAAFEGREPLAAGVEGMARWRRFAGLVVLRWGLLLLALVPVFAAAVGVVGTFGGPSAVDPTAPTPEVAAALLAALVGVVLTAGAVLVVFALLAFVGPALVVDDVGLGTAVGRSVRVPFREPAGFVGYAVVVAVSYGVVGGAALGFGVAGVSRLLSLGTVFLVTPVLDGVGVGLYRRWREGWDDGEGPAMSRAEQADSTGFVFGTRDEPGETGTEGATERVREQGGYRPEEMPPAAEETNVLAGVVGTFRDGLVAVAGFVRHGWRYVALSAAVLVGAVAAGWRATVGYGVQLDVPGDPATVFGVFPVGPFVNIAVNNWLVASGAGFSGLFGGLPTLGTLAFNGLLVGAVAGVVEPLAFVALVGPHGIVELPAIAVAGGVGFRLGHVAVSVWRGKRERPALVVELDRTWRRLLGLAVVFVVAAFVEAFVTPQVAAAVLG